MPSERRLTRSSFTVNAVCPKVGLYLHIFAPDQVLDRFRKLERLGVALKPRDASSSASV
jgi:hypothetical protein